MKVFSLTVYVNLTSKIHAKKSYLYPRMHYLALLLFLYSLESDYLLDLIPALMAPTASL